MKPILVITRPNPAAERFARAVTSRLGHVVPVVHAPAFVIQELDVLPPRDADHLVFTSAHGVAQAVRLNLPRVTAWCVGDKTAELARAAGFSAISANGDAEDLVALIKDQTPSGNLLHVAGKHARGDIAARLTAAGMPCRRFVTYQQVSQPPTDALLAVSRGTNPVIAPVFSPRSAHIVGGLDWQGVLHGIAISDSVAEALTDLGADTVTTAEAPTESAMVDATVARIQAVLDR